MKRVALVILALLAPACDEAKPDTPEETRVKEECKQVLQHIVTISPEGEGKDAAAVVAELPIEDIQSCMASPPDMRACMGKATNVAGVAKCPALVACADKAAAAQKKATEGTKKAEADFDAVRARCLAGDEHAADTL